ncbi:unnamed protein product [Lasius platythorax]|uniref:Uncharacterized protein n=1 Tax=Lasius platythorax TaxID=488582 RepID=A0AAV2NBJ0_9HYME
MYGKVGLRSFALFPLGRDSGFGLPWRLLAREVGVAKTRPKAGGPVTAAPAPPGRGRVLALARGKVRGDRVSLLSPRSKSGLRTFSRWRWSAPLTSVLVWIAAGELLAGMGVSCLPLHSGPPREGGGGMERPRPAILPEGEG